MFSGKGYTWGMVRRSRPRLTDVAESKIFLNGQTIPYIVKRSARARRVRLEMRSETGLTVVIPRTYPLVRLPELLKKKQRWILVNFVKHKQGLPPLNMQHLKSGDVVLYLGQLLKVVVKEGGIAGQVRLDRRRLIVSLGKENNELNYVLEQWYLAQAEELFQQKTAKWGAKLGVNYSKVTVRAQKHRWASCSPRGNLSYNWKLILAPEPIIDYVVIHELLHLKEMNHSKKFWQLVADYCPEWRERKQWLEVHENELKAGLIARQLPLGT